MAHIERQVDEIIAAMLERQRAKAESASKPPRDRENASKCAVCTKDAVSRCSKCRVVWFCGRECAKLLWPSHKALCGADPDYFRVAPLTHNECLDLEPLLDGPIYSFADEVCEQLPLTLRQAMTLQYLRGFEDVEEDLGSWTEVKRLLQQPALSSASLNSYQRDPRHTLIGIARTQLGCLYLREGWMADPRHNEPWPLARGMTDHIVYAYGKCEEDLQIGRPFNRFLRQLLIFFTMVSHLVKARKDQDDLYLGYMRIALNRAQEELEETDCPPFVKAQILSVYFRSLEDEFHPRRIRERRGEM